MRCALLIWGTLAFAACGLDGDPLPAEETEGTSGSSDGDGSESPSSGADATGTTSGNNGSTGGPSGSTAADSSGETGDFPPPVDYAPCSFYTGDDDQDAECATFDVPLDWSDPDGQSIELFLKRLGGGDGSIQLYMLMGGPGGSGVGYEDDAEELLEQMPGLEVYLIDHRGTGRSTPLGDLDEAQLLWGEGLDHFSTSNAARDLGWLVDRAREPGKDIQIYGASYGSYWGLRYLQLFPDQPDGVTLLGIAAPGFNFNTWSLDFNQAGLELLAVCDDDPVCSARLGPDAVQRAFQILVDVAQGHCAASGLTIDMLRTYFSTRVAWHWESRALVPAILHRLERCNAGDVAALQAATPQIANPFTFETEPPAWSATLGNHIRLSELTDEPLPTDDELATIDSSSIFTLGSLIGMAGQYAAWPRYTPDELDAAYPDTAVPMLMLHGEFDPNAPLPQALPMQDRFDGPNQNFFLIPHGVHAWPSPYPGGPSCMRQLFLDFLAAPTAELDDCTDEVYPMSFDQDQLAPGFFGTDSLWD